MRCNKPRCRRWIRKPNSNRSSANDQAVAKHLDDATLANLFDYNYFIEQIDPIFARLGIEETD